MPPIFEDVEALGFGAVTGGLGCGLFTLELEDATGATAFFGVPFEDAVGAGFGAVGVGTGRRAGGGGGAGAAAGGTSSR